MPAFGSSGPRVVFEAVVKASRSHAALSRIGIVVSNAVKQKLSHAGSGEPNPRGGNRSAPGQPPAVDTGRLRNSIDYHVGTDAAGGYVDVGTSVEYASYLETGTSRMAARPFMRPAVAGSKQAVEAIIIEEIVRAQREAVRGLPREIIIE